METENSHGEITEVKSYTQEEVNKLIDEAVKGVELDIESRIDKAIKTRENDLNKQFKAEKDNLINQNLTSEEKVSKLAAEIELIQRENKINQNKIKIERELAKSGIGLGSDELSSLIDQVVSADEEKSVNLVNSIIKLIDTERTRLSDQYNSKMADIPKPKQSGEQSMTNEEFSKLSFGEQVTFCSKYPELARQFMNGGR